MYQIGIDIGGTTVKAGLVKEGRILSWKSVVTDVDAGADKVIADIAGLVNALKDDAGDKIITGVGIGCPGAVNSCSGVVDQAYNLKWEYVPLGEKMQRLTGYAVYYEKNPQMQEFMIAEKERMAPRPLRESYAREERDEVVQNYRAIMNKLNEKPARKKLQPAIYVAGVAVLAIVAATGVTQIGNYQNLKVLEQTMQTLSGAVGSEDADTGQGESQETSEPPEETPPETETV